MTSSDEPFIHRTADVGDAHVGARTRVWQFCVVLTGAKVGSDCNICAHVFIEGDVVVGDRVTVKSGVQLWDGTRVEDDAFIGPNVSFTNDRMPRSRMHPDAFDGVRVGRGASIGAGAVLLPGVTIGPMAMIGAGSVVTKDVPERALVVGNPARLVRFLHS